MTRREKRAKAFAGQAREREAMILATFPGGVFARPHDVDSITAVLGADSTVYRLMPAHRDLPAEFREGDSTIWHKLQRAWFFGGLDARSLVPRPGIDRRKAIAHLSAIQRSFAPTHEHKRDGVAYLLSLWFEEP